MYEATSANDRLGLAVVGCGHRGHVREILPFLGGNLPIYRQSTEQYVNYDRALR